MAQTNGKSGDHSPYGAAPKVLPLWINGKEETLTSTFQVRSPATNEFLFECSSASVEDANRAINAAQAAAKSWAKTKPAVRSAIFLKAAQIVESRIEEFTEILSAETGANAAWSTEINIPFALGYLRDIAGRIPTIEGRQVVSAHEGKSALILKEPYGVVLGIAPWNAPYVLGLRAFAYPIATGNTVVLKGSELSPRCYWALGKVFEEAGLPAGVLNILLYRPEDAPSVTGSLIANPAVKKVNFTGSTAVGAIIAEQCGKHLKPCLMELGGKNSVIVLEDADLPLAAKLCALGGLLNAGQICMSTDRVIVHKSVVAEFKRLLIDAIKEMSPEDGPGPQLISAGGVKKTKAIVKSTLDAGAEVIYGKYDTSEEASTRMRPIVINGIKKGMAMYSDESFGPAMGIIEIDHEDQAVEIMNDTDYGLSASLFTRDLRKALRLSKEIESGAIHINGMTVHDEAAIPHGGVGQSGWGRFNNQDGLEEFMKTKTVTWDD